MSEFLFTPKAIPYLEIHKKNIFFPVHRIYCVGRNYAAHAVEMGHDPDKELPFFFQKNPDNLVLNGKFPYPPLSHVVHYEVELVVALKKGGENLNFHQAQEAIFGYAIGLDMTRRDLQNDMKKAGRPWEIAKAFEYSAPCSKLTEAKDCKGMDEGVIGLKVNDETKQIGNLNQMIWKIPEIIMTLSKFYHLSAGDLIMTGTPAGVGSIHKGDKIHAFIEGLDDLNIEVI